MKSRDLIENQHLANGSGGLTARRRIKSAGIISPFLWKTADEQRRRSCGVRRAARSDVSARWTAKYVTFGRYSVELTGSGAFLPFSSRPATDAKWSGRAGVSSLARHHRSAAVRSRRGSHGIDTFVICRLRRRVIPRGGPPFQMVNHVIKDRFRAVADAVKRPLYI